ncbi:MAG: class I SAM-dependent methyltransferase [Chthoniobacterales bacterium]
MSPVEIETMRAVEDDLWWYRALRSHVIDSLAPARPDFKLLDAGCGSGGMLARVRRHFPSSSLTGMDYVPRALELTRERDLRAELVHGSADALPFAENAFDVVLSLDVIVLAGIDDQKAVQEMHRVLRPGGTLLINVAAFNFLRGSHDAATSMARRYTRPRLAKLLRTAGFSRPRLSYWNMLLLPLVAAVRWASRKRAQDPGVRSDLAPIWPPLNALLSGVVKAELALSRQLPLPFGTSLFAVAQK